MNGKSVGDGRTPLVSIIIVNYNGLRFLADCLESVKTALVKFPSEVIVVDNASTDGSREYLQQRSDIRLIASPINTGFTGGNNLGVRDSRGDVILLLNNDTRVETSLDPMIEQLMESGVGGVGCRLRYGDGRVQFSMGLEHTPARVVLSWLGLERYFALPSVFRRLQTDPARYAEAHSEVSWVSGACFATWRSVWLELRGFDEHLFMYCEDVDYCRRLRNLGLRVAYIPSSLVTHYEGAGKPWIGAAALLRTSRSYYIYTSKHYGKFRAWLVCACLCSIFAARAAAFFLLGTAAGTSQRRSLRYLKAGGFARAFGQMARVLVSGKEPPLP
jgi:GT2 family glycosyltransferase